MMDSGEKLDAFGESTGWHTNLEEFMQHIFAAKGNAYWCCDWDVKYLNIRIDTRDNAYLLKADGRGDSSNMKNTFAITPRKVLDAMDEWFDTYDTRNPVAESRSVACVNAMQDIVDPAELMRDVRKLPRAVGGIGIGRAIDNINEHLKGGSND